MSQVDYVQSFNPGQFDAGVLNGMSIGPHGQFVAKGSEQVVSQAKVSETKPALLPELEIVGAELRSAGRKTSSVSEDHSRHIEASSSRTKQAGSDTLEKSDGTKIEFRPDGSIVTITQRGVKSSLLPDGVWVREYPDGTKSTEYPFSHPASGRVVEFRDGTKITERRDGSKIIETRDGIRSAWLPDGSHVEL